MQAFISSYKRAPFNILMLEAADINKHVSQDTHTHSDAEAISHKYSNILA